MQELPESTFDSSQAGFSPDAVPLGIAKITSISEADCRMAFQIPGDEHVHVDSLKVTIGVINSSENSVDGCFYSLSICLFHNIPFPGLSPLNSTPPDDDGCTYIYAQDKGINSVLPPEYRSPPYSMHHHNAKDAYAIVKVLGVASAQSMFWHA